MKRSFTRDVKSQANSLRVISRTFALLERLSEGSMGVTEASLQFGFSKATVHRTLSTLVALGYVRQEPSRDYVLTPKLLELVSGPIYGLDLRQMSRPYLHRLASHTKETVILGVLDGRDVVLLDQVEPPITQGLGIITRVGSRVPCHSTAIGKVLLAHLPPETLAEVIGRVRLTRFTPQTVSTVDELRKMLDEVRRNGYAINNEELYEGVVAVAAPLRDYNREVVAAISVACAAFRTPRDMLPELAEQVKQEANEISAALGGGRPEGEIGTVRKGRRGCGPSRVRLL